MPKGVYIRTKENNTKSIRLVKYKKYTCYHCGIEFERKPSHPVSRNFPHCSKECYNKSDARKKLIKISWSNPNKYKGRKPHSKKISDYIEEHYKEYRRCVDAWTSYNLRIYNPKMFREWKDADITVDHKYPCIQGFLRLIEPKLIAHTDNLQLMSKSKNSSKNDTIIKEIIPDILKEEVKKPIVMGVKYFRLDRPPNISKVVNTDYINEDNIKFHLVKYYFYDIIKNEILSLKWNKPYDVIHNISSKYNLNKKIVLDVFKIIWFDDLKLPKTNYKKMLNEIL